MNLCQKKGGEGSKPPHPPQVQALAISPVSMLLMFSLSLLLQIQLTKGASVQQ